MDGGHVFDPGTVGLGDLDPSDPPDVFGLFSTEQQQQPDPSSFLM